jgi:hypothetical protein
MEALKRGYQEDQWPEGIRATIIIIIHLLGLAPAGYLVAPDNGA